MVLKYDVKNYEENSSKIRITSLDVCKGICILMVILGHQFQKLKLREILQYIQTFHMPLFFLIAGFCININISKKKYLIVRAKRLLLSYVLACVLGMILYILRQAIDKRYDYYLLIKEWVWISLYASGSGHGSYIGSYGYSTEIGMLWYLVALFWSCIIVRAICEEDCAIIYSLAISSIGIGSSLIIDWIPFSVQVGLGTVFWVYIGYHIKERGLLPIIIQSICSPMLVLLFVAWLLSARYGCIHLYGNLYELGFVDVIGALTGSMLVFGLSSVITKYSIMTTKILSWIGKNSLYIFVWHFIENKVNPICELLMTVITFKNNYLLAFLSWMIISICCIALTIITKAVINKMIKIFHESFNYN